MKIKDRSAKVNRRKSRMPMNGVAFKRLLIERVAALRKKAHDQETKKR